MQFTFRQSGATPLPQPRFRIRTSAMLICLAMASAVLITLSPSLFAEEAPPAFVTKWGTYGSGNGQFNDPTGVAVDASGNVYVVDQYNWRVQKFDANGNYLLQWGQYGFGNGQFQNAFGVAVDTAGDVYVGEWFNYRIQKFHPNGAFVMKWGSQGSGDGQFIYLRGIAVDAAGNVYAADTNNQRIQKFNSAGAFVAKWGSFGSGDGQFRYPFGIAVDPSGNVYVADHQNYRIQKFDSNGVFLGKWGSQGTGDGQFQYPVIAVASDPAGKIYVADITRIQKFDSNGVFLTKWGKLSYGSGDGEFLWPTGLAIDAAYNVYVADQYNYRIQKFAYPDTSPPLVSAVLSPLPNAAGWNRTDLTVVWNAADPESGISSRSGCGDTILSQETAGATLTCTATNGVGLSASASVTVKLDKTPPVISGLPAACTLWPPNHMMVPSASVSANGSISGLTNFSMTVSSNEPATGSDPDWMVTGPLLGPFNVALRADRSATGSGRVYTLRATAADLAGNIAASVATCTVPHDLGKN